MLPEVLPLPLPQHPPLLLPQVHPEVLLQQVHLRVLQVGSEPSSLDHLLQVLPLPLPQVLLPQVRPRVGLAEVEQAVQVVA